MTHTPQNTATLVLGGTGKTGRRVATRLPGARVGSRTGTPPFDWTDPATWEPVLDGIEAAYLAYYPDIAAPGAAETIGAFAKVAAGAGVRRLVLLSGRGIPRALDAERALADAGTDWTVLRASWFWQNFSEEFLTEGVRAGEVVLPAAPGALEPFTDAEDIADMAVAALTDPDRRHAGRIYELTGESLLTFEEAAAEIGRAAGHEVRFRTVAPAAYADLLSGQGLPPEAAGFLAELFGEVLDGRNGQVTDDIRRVLGRPPRTVADYTSAAAASGAWGTGG